MIRVSVSQWILCIIYTQSRFGKKIYEANFYQTIKTTFKLKNGKCCKVLDGRLKALLLTFGTGRQ